MDEHPDRPLRPAEHARDLRGAELVDEAQDHRLATLAGQASEGLPGCPRLVPPDRLGLDVERVDDDRVADRLRWPSTRTTPLPGDLVAGDLEQPDAERRGALAVRGTGT